MPKLKSKSGAKKRFTLTGTGKIKRHSAGKRHNMRKRTGRMIRQTRGSVMLDAADEKRVRRFIPYG